MTTKYTQGPWQVVKTNDGMTVNSDRKRLEIVYKYPDGSHQIVIGKHTGLDCLTPANAALIAAAPDMLEALQNAVNAEAVGDKIDFKEILAAIHKATGGNTP